MKTKLSGNRKIKLKPRKESSSYSRKYTRSNFGSGIYLIIVFAFGLFSMLPLVYSVATSFKPLDELLVFPPRFFVYNPTLQNYSALPRLLSNLSVPLSKYIFNSVFLSVASTAIYIFIATLAAFALAKADFKGKKFLFLLIQYALLFNSFTLAIPQYIISANIGIIDTYWAYILPGLASTMGVFLMKQYMEGAIPNALLEAAEIEGADPFKIFFRIVVPMVKSCIMTLMLFQFSSAWSQAPNGMIFRETIKTLPAVMSQISAGGIARSGSAMSVTVIMMMPPIIVYFISQSNVLESMNSAGIKE